MNKKLIKIGLASVTTLIGTAIVVSCNTNGNNDKDKDVVTKNVKISVPDSVKTKLPSDIKIEDLLIQTSAGAVLKPGLVKRFNIEPNNATGSIKVSITTEVEGKEVTEEFNFEGFQKSTSKAKMTEDIFKSLLITVDASSKEKIASSLKKENVRIEFANKDVLNHSKLKSISLLADDDARTVKVTIVATIDNKDVSREVTLNEFAKAINATELAELTFTIAEDKYQDLPTSVEKADVKIAFKSGEALKSYLVNNIVLTPDNAKGELTIKLTVSINNVEESREITLNGFRTRGENLTLEEFNKMTVEVKPEALLKQSSLLNKADVVVKYSDGVPYDINKIKNVGISPDDDKASTQITIGVEIEGVVHTRDFTINNFKKGLKQELLDSLSLTLPPEFLKNVPSKITNENVKNFVFKTSDDQSVADSLFNTISLKDSDYEGRLLVTVTSVFNRIDTSRTFTVTGFKKGIDPALSETLVIEVSKETRRKVPTKVLGTDIIVKDENGATLSSDVIKSISLSEADDIKGTLKVSVVVFTSQEDKTIEATLSNFAIDPEYQAVLNFNESVDELLAIAENATINNFTIGYKGLRNKHKSVDEQHTRLVADINQKFHVHLKSYEIATQKLVKLEAALPIKTEINTLKMSVNKSGAIYTKAELQTFSTQAADLVTKINATDESIKNDLTTLVTPIQEKIKTLIDNYETELLESVKVLGNRAKTIGSFNYKIVGKEVTDAYNKVLTLQASITNTSTWDEIQKVLDEIKPKVDEVALVNKLTSDVSTMIEKIPNATAANLNDSNGLITLYTQFLTEFKTLPAMYVSRVGNYKSVLGKILKLSNLDDLIVESTEGTITLKTDKIDNLINKQAAANLETTYDIFNVFVEGKSEDGYMKLINDYNTTFKTVPANIQAFLPVYDNNNAKLVKGVNHYIDTTTFLINTYATLSQATYNESYVEKYVEEWKSLQAVNTGAKGTTLESVSNLAYTALKPLFERILTDNANPDKAKIVKTNTLISDTTNLSSRMVLTGWGSVKNYPTVKVIDRALEFDILAKYATINDAEYQAGPDFDNAKAILEIYRTLKSITLELKDEYKGKTAAELTTIFNNDKTTVFIKDVTTPNVTSGTFSVTKASRWNPAFTYKLNISMEHKGAQIGILIQLVVK